VSDPVLDHCLSASDKRHPIGVPLAGGARRLAMAQPANRPIPLSVLSVDELRARAREYQEMARSARVTAVHASLLRLAERFAALADLKQAAARQTENGAAELPEERSKR
jgi:hypothetical protein